MSERQIALALDLGQAAGDGSWQQVADVHQAASGAGDAAAGVAV